jgi:hypothetical protein
MPAPGCICCKVCLQVRVKTEAVVSLTRVQTPTDYKDAPLPISGDRPNTATGKFLVRKGRMQLKKPKGVGAISGNVIVGGQGFDDCLS